MQYKQAGISILVAMGTSLLVLSLAFATLNSIGNSLDQAGNIQRSTQLFFAAESGAEAAFFHHNSRGAGLEFANGNDVAQTLDHSEVNAETNWTLTGRTTTSDTNSATVGHATVVDILREGQTVQIPLQWDGSANPSVDVNQNGKPNNNSDNLSVTFFRDPSHIGASTARDAFTDANRFNDDTYPIPVDFDFGEASNNAILVDWSISRKNSNRGIQTFIPTSNQDCAGFVVGPGYICENDYVGMTSNGLQLDTNDTISGKVLPGSIDIDLDQFWDCSVDNKTAFGGDNCSDFQFTMRPLLNFRDTISGKKIPGLPYELKLTTGNTTPKSFPKSTYTVTSDVALEDFSQQIQIEVPEKTSIGAFDYVIFD